MCCDDKSYELDVRKSVEKKLRETAWVIDMLYRNGLLGGPVYAPVNVAMCVSKKEQYNARIAGEQLAAKFLLLYAQDPTLAWSGVSVSGDTVRLKVENVAGRNHY